MTEGVGGFHQGLASAEQSGVLVVGETADTMTCLRIVLSIRDFEVVGVVRADTDALEAVEALRPDLVLVCGESARTGLLELLDRLRDRGRHHCDVLLVASRPRPDLVLGAARLGVFSCLVSPVDPRALRARLDVWLGRRQLTEHKAPHDALDQDEVNLLLHGPAPAREPRQSVTPTFEIVAMTLRNTGGYLSASDIGMLCNLSAVATRRYLKQLVDQGDAVVAMQYGKTGRPRHVYRWAG